MQILLRFATTTAIEQGKYAAMDQVVARSGKGSMPANPLLAAPILPTLLRLTLPNLAAMLVTALVAIAETVLRRHSRHHAACGHRAGLSHWSC